MATIDWVGLIKAYIASGTGALNQGTTTALDSAGDVLQRVGQAVQAYIEKTCGRRLEAEDRVDAVDGNGRTYLYLPADPIISLGSVVMDGLSLAIVSPSTVQVSTLRAASVAISQGRDAIELLNYGVFARGQRNVVVTYTAGLTPEDPGFHALVQAGVVWAAHLYKHKAYTHLGSSNKGQQQATYEPSVPKRLLDELLKSFVRTSTRCS